MRVKVLYFGVLKELLGLGGEEVALAEESSVSVLLESIKQRGKAHAEVWSSIAIAVNQEYVSAATLLHDGDEVALLPPVSGGL